jgi:hypothetical protein
VIEGKRPTFERLVYGWWYAVTVIDYYSRYLLAA